LIDARWLVLVLAVVGVAVAVWLLPALVAPITLAVAVAGVLYLLLRLDRQ